MEKLIEKLAANQHETWRQAKVERGTTTRTSTITGAELIRAYPELEEADKEENRRQVRDNINALIAFGPEVVLEVADAALMARQESVGRGLGGQEIAYARTRVREARLFLADAPTVTLFTEKKS